MYLNTSNWSVAFLLRLNEIHLFRYHSESNVFKINPENFTKLALLFFEGNEFFRSQKKTTIKVCIYIHKIIEDNTT